MTPSCQDWNTILVCRSVTIKNRLYHMFREGHFSITPLCLTIQELQYFYEEYPPKSAEAIEKFTLHTCLKDQKFKGLSNELLASTSILDPLLQLIKQAQKAQKRLPGDCQKIRHQFQTSLPGALHPLQFNDDYWDKLRRLIQGKRLVCIGFYEWSPEETSFFEACRPYIDELRVILPYHPLNQQHLFLHHFYQDLANLGAKAQVPVSSERTDPVHLYRANDSEDELQFVFQSILQEIQNGRSPQQIGIVLPDLADSKEKVIAMAKELSIPISLSVGTPFMDSPLSDLLLEALTAHDHLFPEFGPFKDFQQVIDAHFDSKDLLDSFQHLPEELATLHAHFLTQLEESLNELSDIFTTPMQRADAFQLLRFLNDNLEIRPLKTAADEIQVLSKKEALSCYKDLLFICGFQEGKWPDRVSKSPFLSAKEHASLGLNTNQTNYLFHLYLFDILQHQTPSVYLSYSANLEDVEQSPSHLTRFCHSIKHATSPGRYIESEQSYQAALGHYLRRHSIYVTKNPAIDQRAAMSAKETHSPTYWGTLQTPSALAQIAAVLKDRPVSATSLDLYQSCPYSFFYREMLLLNQTDPSPASLNPMDWGVLVHDILQHALQDSPVPNKETFTRQLSARLSRLDLSGFAKQVAQDKLCGTPDREGLIDWYLSDLETLSTEFTPLFFEYSIEKTGTDFHLDLGSQQIPVRGSIDVIYGNSSGDVIILDYKTGASIPSAAELERYEKCQLPLYLLAFLQQNPSYQAAALAYHQLYKADKHEIQIKLCDPEKRDQVLGKSRKRPKPLDATFFEGLKAHLGRVRQLQHQGFFSPLGTPELPNPLKNRPKTCSSCDHKLLCRYPKRFEGDRL